MKIVEIKKLNVKYGKSVVLKNINFDVEENDFLGIIGPNGAGKTTLFSCMLGMIKQYEGTIKFFGNNIQKSKKYLKNIGYVQQKPSFDKNFPITVKEVIEMGLNCSEDKINDALNQVLIHELANKRIGELSTGQQQRVFIAKALVGNPKILILDEPVTGIDTHSTELFYSMLNKMHLSKITIILSSHDLNAVNMLANKVACLNRTLFFHGVSKDFFNNDTLLKKYSESSMQKHIQNHKNGL
ncbi:MAG: metal ABC transporter ATP-binding protein [Thaumarchaeota archaeon]|nr:metal ABC transporter ATP-binding protein [Nitrososphaerota archaeon]MCY3975794.1 metal ABC transporter ATP-binding protein [Nitrososphaerota archaeon]